MPVTAVPTLPAKPLTAVTVLVSPSVDVGVVVEHVARGRRVARLGQVAAGLTPDSMTASAALVSATATGASFVPVIVMVSVVDEVAPMASFTV